MDPKDNEGEIDASEYRIFHSPYFQKIRDSLILEYPRIKKRRSDYSSKIYTTLRDLTNVQPKSNPIKTIFPLT